MTQSGGVPVQRVGARAWQMVSRPRESASRQWVGWPGFLSVVAALMGSCLRPVRVAPRLLPRSVSRCCSTELAELTGQRNAIDGRIVEIVAEIDHDGLCGMTGCRSVPALVAWKTGMSPRMPTRSPPSRTGSRSSRAARPGCGRAGCRWIRSGSSPNAPPTAPMSTTPSWPRSPPSPSCAPRSSSNHAPNPIRPARTREPLDHARPPMRRASPPTGSRCPTLRPPTFDAALQSHHDALIARVETRPPTTDIGRDDDTERDESAEQRPPFPTTVDGFMAWWTPAGTPTSPAARTGSAPPWWCTSTSTNAVAALHLGPLLTDDDRRYLTCDATCEVWFERHGQLIGAGASHPHHQPPAAPGAGAPRPLLRGPRLRGDPRSARPSHPALGGRRAHRAGQPGAAVSAIITGCTTAAASPSPAPPTTSSSPTPTATTEPELARPDHRPHPHPTSRPARARPANAPTGGGTPLPTPTTTDHQLAPVPGSALK